jgi:GAF domain-containing protein
MDRVQLNQNVLAGLVRMNKSDLAEVLKRVTEGASEALGVERASVWLYNYERSAIVCQDLFQRTERSHERGMKLKRDAFPYYFAALDESRILAVEDARSDRRTFEFKDPYLVPNGITSMLDIPIWVRGKVAGVLCHEHTGAMRAWDEEEQSFATHLADVVSMALLENQLVWLQRGE